VQKRDRVFDSVSFLVLAIKKAMKFRVAGQKPMPGYKKTTKSLFV